MYILKPIWKQKENKITYFNIRKRKRRIVTILGDNINKVRKTALIHVRYNEIFILSYPKK